MASGVSAEGKKSVIYRL